jgi:hypothetical protein
MRASYQVADVLNQEAAHINKICTNSWQERTLRALRKCRTPALGGHIDVCNCCEKLHISYNSCRNRHCPTCQGHKQAAWTKKRMEELLPVGYFHMVFTLPSELNALSLQHPRIVYASLFKAAWATLQSFSEDPKHLGAKMGMLSILHTWGQNMSLHPHLHCIVPGGGITKQGNWKQAKNKGKFLFPVKAMSKVFRAKYVAQLRQHLPGIPQSLYDQLFSKNWVVYAKPPFSKAANVVEYLGRYTHKIAISNHRIKEVNKATKEVTFSYKDYKQGAKTKELTLSNAEFIRRFSLHILPKGFTRIRHYGILSSGWKKEKLPQLQLQLGGENYLQDLLNQKEETHLKRCFSCKKGTLMTVVLFDKRGPPKNWKRKYQQAVKSRS